MVTGSTRAAAAASRLSDHQPLRLRLCRGHVDLLLQRGTGRDETKQASNMLPSRADETVASASAADMKKELDLQPRGSVYWFVLCCCLIRPSVQTVSNHCADCWREPDRTGFWTGWQRSAGSYCVIRARSVKKTDDNHGEQQKQNPVHISCHGSCLKPQTF